MLTKTTVMKKVFYYLHINFYKFFKIFRWTNDIVENRRLLIALKFPENKLNRTLLYLVVQE